MIRWLIECFFGGFRQYRFFDKRQTDTDYFDPIGKLLKEFPNIPKIEILINNVICNMNRNRKPMIKQFHLPEGYSKQEFGYDARHRFFSENELNRFIPNPVQFSVSFDRLPNVEKPGDWVPTIYDDQNIGLGPFEHEELFILSMGPYQIDNAPRYVTDIRQREVDVDPDVNEFSYTQYDQACSSLPVNTPVFFIDEAQRPSNWDEELYGEWYPRRILLMGVPSIHSQKVHRVVLFFVPTCEALPANFHNRFRFQHGNLQRLVGFGCVTCPTGLRTFGVCSHVLAVLTLVGVYSHDKETFRSKYKPAHIFDVANPKSINVSMFA